MSYLTAVLFSAPVTPRNGSTPASLPGVAGWHFGRRVKGARITTTEHGFGTFSGTYCCGREEARELIRRGRFRHVEARSVGSVVFEGRIEKLSRAAEGVQFEAAGYWSSAGDEPYSQATLAPGDAGAILMRGLKDFNYAPQLSSDYQMMLSTAGMQLGGSDYSTGEALTAIAERLLRWSDEDPPGISYHVAVWEDRRVWLQRQEFMAISYTIPRRAIEADPAYGVDVQSTYTGAIAIYGEQTSGDGNATTVTRTISPVYTTDDAYPIEDAKAPRIAVGTGSQEVKDSNQAQAVAKGELTKAGRGIDEFTVTVTGRIRDHVGRWIPPQLCRAGTLAILPTRPTDYLKPIGPDSVVLILETDWDVDAHRVELHCGPAPGSVVRSSAATSTPTGSSGLQRATA